VAYSIRYRAKIVVSEDQVFSRETGYKIVSILTPIIYTDMSSYANRPSPLMYLVF
jgi:hypothetical protein